MSEPTAQQVAEAVRAVLGPRALGPAGVAEAAVVIPGRLLSGRDVEALPEGTAAVRLAASAVITPVARDLLKRRRIRVLLSADGAEPWRREYGFCVESNDGAAEAMRRGLLKGVEVWHDLRETALALGWVAQVPERSAVVVTARAALRVWQAGRVENVRAAQAFDAWGVQRALDDLAANVLVVDSRAHSLWEVLQLCRTYRRLAGQAEPWKGGAHEDWRDRGASDVGAPAREPAGGPMAAYAADAAGSVAGGLNGARR